VLNFEFRRLCTVPLGQIVRADDVNDHPAVVFESVYCAAEAYLKQALFKQRFVKGMLAALASSKATQKDRKRFFQGVKKHVKVAVQLMFTKCPLNNEFSESLAASAFPSQIPSRWIVVMLYITRELLFETNMQKV